MFILDEWRENMKTQISIQVKNENLFSRCMSIYMSLGLFVKAKVKMYIDDGQSTPIILKARKEPYTIDIEPGEHAIAFTAKNKGSVDKIIGGAVLGTIGMGAGNAFTGLVAANAGADFSSGLMGHSRIQDNLLECDLQEGDLLKIRIQPKRNGAVKIQLI